MSREAFEAWAMPMLGDNPTWRESGPCELAWRAWQAAQADAYERAAKVCRELDDAPFADIEQPTPHDCADAIEALAKGAT
jgi:hypothetical protein